MFALIDAIQEAGATCPGCIVNSSPGVMDGLFWGLVFMMVTPFLVLIVFGGSLVKAKRADLRDAHRQDGAGTGVGR